MGQIKEMIEVLQNIVTCLQGEEEGKGYAMLVEAVPQLERISNAIIEQEGENTLMAGLVSIIEGLENQDKWMIADVIQYEIIEKLNEYT